LEVRWLVVLAFMVLPFISEVGVRRERGLRTGVNAGDPHPAGTAKNRCKLLKRKKGAQKSLQ